VGEFQEAGVGQFQAQLFDDAETDAATAMHRLTGRFVDDQQGIVAVDHPIQQRLRDGAVRRGRRRFRHAHRRNADFIAFDQFVFGFGAAAADAQFTFAQHAVDATFRYALEHAEQKVVQTLPGLL
jgi:hypothetical protein